jgi:hypothetical protein
MRRLECRAPLRLFRTKLSDIGGIVKIVFGGILEDRKLERWSQFELLVKLLIETEFLMLVK